MRRAIIGTCKSAYTKGYALNWVLTKIQNIMRDFKDIKVAVAGTGYVGLS